MDIETLIAKLNEVRNELDVPELLKTDLQRFLDTYDGTNVKELQNLFANLFIFLQVVSIHKAKADGYDMIDASYEKMKEELGSIDDILDVVINNKPFKIPDAVIPSDKDTPSQTTPQNQG